MKTIRLLPLLIALTAVAAAAQPPPMEEIPPPDAPALAPEPMAPDGPPLDRWLERLRAKDPAEYERLQQIRREGPEGFRRALHGKLRDERILARFQEFPKLCQFLLAMPEEERERIMKRIGAGTGPLRGGPGGPGGPRGEPPAPSPELAALEAEVHRLSQVYRDESDPAGKERLLGDLREQLEALFDLREQGREEHIARIEKDLARLKESFERRRELKDKIIERRIKELTEGDVLGW